jgi:hypothetical protein
MGDAIDNFHQLIGGTHLPGLVHRQDFLPQTGAFVADDIEVEMVLSVFDLLSKPAEGELDVLRRAGQKYPPRFSVEAVGVGPELLGSIGYRVYGEGQQQYIVAQSLAKALLQIGEHSGHSRTTILARRKEGIENNNLPPQKIGIQTQLLAILIDQQDVSEILLRCRIARGFVASLSAAVAKGKGNKEA